MILLLIENTGEGKIKLTEPCFWTANGGVRDNLKWLGYFCLARGRYGRRAVLISILEGAGLIPVSPSMETS